jgi:4-hydroxy-tetrahydrodipicolinate synthase
MLKHEAWPGLDKISTLRRAEADGARRVSILCGNGGLSSCWRKCCAAPMAR